ncbi:hypothetical protein OK351_12585 [Glutamicibacter sp. MNS18]|uniref:hypothetical protein n=1 Tax=Glutamicibacter sp. MNS18 TaxID=2989817 RepID=UPI0022368ADA|nr:hypothetical protein [Glutamicibacter sp. MNS18]MCW4466334.1 hypothetical protein [Glutamicibacter sp. MNS18]
MHHLLLSSIRLETFGVRAKFRAGMTRKDSNFLYDDASEITREGPRASSSREGAIRQRPCAEVVAGYGNLRVLILPNGIGSRSWITVCHQGNDRLVAVGDPVIRELLPD